MRNLNASDISWIARSDNKGRPFEPDPDQTIMLDNGTSVFEFDDTASLFNGDGNAANARGGNGGGGGGGGKGGPKNNGFSAEDYTSGTKDANGNLINAENEYNVSIVFEGSGWTQELYDAFVLAADLISEIITGDRPDYVYQKGPGSKGMPRNDIDDIQITATLGSIDGVGGILGQAGPTFIISGDGGETDPYLPFAGIMEFDTADALQLLADGEWATVVLHEMLHVVGIGTMWEYNGVVTDNQDGTYTYNGDARDPNNMVPEIEEDGGSGTAGGHWDEGNYPTNPTDGPGYNEELMTGYIDSSIYVAAMTWQTLIDLGYEVTADYEQYTGDMTFDPDDGFMFA